MKPITELLAAYKAKAGATDAEMAAELGVGQPTVSDWVMGRRIPDDRRSAALAKLLGMSEDDVAMAISYTRRRKAQNMDEAMALITQLQGQVLRLERELGEVRALLDPPAQRGRSPRQR